MTFDPKLNDLGDPVPWRMPVEIAAEVAPAPSPAAEPPHDLRDGLARTLYERDDAAEFTTWAQLPDWNRRMWLSDADALLAGPLAPLLARLTRAEAAVQRAEALAARYEATSRRRRLLAEKWQEAGRWQLADGFRNLAHQSDVAAARIRAALAPVPHDADGGERR